MVVVAVAVVLGALVLLGMVAAASGEGTSGGGATRALAVGAGVVVLLVVLAVVVGGVGLDMRSSSPSEDAAPEEGTPPVSTVPVGPPPLRQPTINLVAGLEDELPLVPGVVGDLAEGEVVVLGVAGLDPGSAATVHQCPTGAARPSACRAGVPLSADDGGRAVVLVDLQDRLAVGGADEVPCVGARTTGCSIVVFGSARLEVVTVFGAAAPPPIGVSADPPAVPPGGTTQVMATGLPRGARASFAICRPGGRGEADCGAETATVAVDDTGRAMGTITVPAGRCPRGGTCGIAVLVGDDGGPQAFASLLLIGRAGPGYDHGRLRLGLGAAAALLLIAVGLLRRTDWTAVEGDPFAGVTIPDDPFAEDEVRTLDR